MKSLHFLYTALISVVLIFIGTPFVLAQSKVEVVNDINYSQDVTPYDFDNYLYSSYFISGKKAYNLRGYKISSAQYKALSIKVNPAGRTFAVLSSNGKKWNVNIYSLNDQNEMRFPLNGNDARAICYTADSRNLIVADANGVLKYYDTRTYSLVKEQAIGMVPTKMVASSNGFYIALVSGNEVTVINQSTGVVRTKKSFEEDVKDVNFSAGSSLLGVLTSDILRLYSCNTYDFSLKTEIKDFANATSFSFHPDGKYVCVSTGGDHLEFINMINTNDRSSITDAAGGISKVIFTKDGKKNVYVAYNTPNSLTYKTIKGLSPNYRHILRDELNERLMEWCKRKPTETEKQYNARVNERSKQKHKLLIATEISTRMAGDQMKMQTITLGRYSKKDNALAVNFDKMSPIYLKVPQKDMKAFGDANSLTFTNVKYGLTEDDNFQIVYAEVRNTKNKKTYIYDLSFGSSPKRLSI